MKLLNINSIKKALIPWEYLNDLKCLRGLSDDGFFQSTYAFNYGRIVGIQQERARHKGKKYEKAILVNDSFFYLYKVTSEALEGVPTEELDDFFEYMNDYVTTKMSDSVRDKVLMLLDAIKKQNYKKEAIN